MSSRSAQALAPHMGSPYGAFLGLTVLKIRFGASGLIMLLLDLHRQLLAKDAPSLLTEGLVEAGREAIDSASKGGVRLAQLVCQLDLPAAQRDDWLHTLTTVCPCSAYLADWLPSLLELPTPWTRERLQLLAKIEFALPDDAVAKLLDEWWSGRGSATPATEIALVGRWRVETLYRNEQGSELVKLMDDGYAVIREAVIQGLWSGRSAFAAYQVEEVLLKGLRDLGGGVVHFTMQALDEFVERAPLGEAFVRRALPLIDSVQHSFEGWSEPVGIVERSDLGGRHAGPELAGQLVRLAIHHGLEDVIAVIANHADPRVAGAAIAAPGIV